MKRLITIVSIFCLVFMAVFGMRDITSYASADGFGVAYTLYVLGYNSTEADDNTAVSTTAYPNALSLRLYGQPEGMSGTILYQINQSGYGWLDVTENGVLTGNVDADAPIEAVKVWLNGDLSTNYDIYTKVLDQDGSWSDWHMNGEQAGSDGVGTHIKGIWVSISKKGAGAPADEGKVQVIGASVLSRVDTTKPMVALTFDDGPETTNTNAILDILEKYDARATFYIVGNRVTGTRANALSRAYALGNEIGNHTYNHDTLTKLSDAQIRSVVGSTSDTVASLTGVATSTLRPPGGKYTSSTLETLQSMGYPVIMWSVDTLDWKTRSASATVSAVLDTVKDGDIVLMHDLYASTAEAAKTIIPELINRGYQLVTVSELAAARGGMQAGEVYYSFR